jgi:hypothetical protein
MRGLRRRNTHTIRNLLTVLPGIEAATPVLPSPVRGRFAIRDWQACAVDALSGAALRRLPVDERDTGGPGAVRGQVAAASAASMVRLSKFSTHRDVRARVFYLDRATPVTMKIVVGAGVSRARLEREIEVRQALAASSDNPAGPLLDVGLTDEHCYLVEPVVFGSHPRGPQEKQAVAARLVSRMVQLHRRNGVADEPFELHPQLLPRIGRLVADPVWAGAVADPAAVVERAAALVADAPVMPTGWCHGDLGFSNIIHADDGGEVLIDWEYGGRLPVAADLAKLIVMSPQPDDLVTQLLGEASPDDIGARPGRAPVLAQLTTALIRELSWWEGRRRRAAAAGRLDNYNRGLRRRARLVHALIRAEAAAR